MISPAVELTVKHKVRAGARAAVALNTAAPPLSSVVLLAPGWMAVARMFVLACARFTASAVANVCAAPWRRSRRAFQGRCRPGCRASARAVSRPIPRALSEDDCYPAVEAEHLHISTTCGVPYPPHFRGVRPCGPRLGHREANTSWAAVSWGSIRAPR